MSLERYLEEALRLVRSSQCHVSICLYKKNHSPTAEEIALLHKLCNAYKDAGIYTERISKIIQVRAKTHKK